MGAVVRPDGAVRAAQCPPVRGGCRPPRSGMDVPLTGPRAWAAKLHRVRAGRWLPTSPRGDRLDRREVIGYVPWPGEGAAPEDWRPGPPAARRTPAEARELDRETLASYGVDVVVLGPEPAPEGPKRAAAREDAGPPRQAGVVVPSADLAPPGPSAGPEMATERPAVVVAETDPEREALGVAVEPDPLAEAPAPVPALAAAAPTHAEMERER